ncbi:MAG: hypothetical protein JWM93_32 [Frankiales bacterium]|nr:hypothetical protein [Frankiales bacterium]
MYSALSLSYHRRLLTTAYDLGIFFQALRSWAHLHLPVVPIKGIHDNLGADFNLLGDHFHPIIAVLAPTYWVWPHPQVLLIDQALILAVAVVPIWVFVNRLHGALSAYLFAGAYVLFWGIQTTVIFDFHEYVFAVPLIAFALERVQVGKFRHATICVLLLLLVKEDMGFVVAAFGLYLLILGRRRLGAALAVAGGFAYVVVTKLLMPYFGGHAYLYWYYSQLGPDLPSALTFLVSHPLKSLQLMLAPPSKTKLLAYLFLPFLALPLLSPITVLAIPLLAERLFSDHPNNYATAFHYSAPLAPILVMGAADALARVKRWLPERFAAPLAPRVSVAIAVAAVTLTAFMPLRQLLLPATWRTSPTVAAGYRALAMVPSGARVEASNRLVPHLVDRTDVVLLDGGRRDVDWSLMWVTRKDWPFEKVFEQKNYVLTRQAQGWVTVLDTGEFVLLRKPQ